LFLHFFNLREGEKNPKKKDKKRSKYVALDFFEKKIKKDKKRRKYVTESVFAAHFWGSKYIALDFSEKTNPKKKDRKRSKYVAESVSAAHFWGVAESASQRPLTGRNALSQTDRRTD